MDNKVGVRFLNSGVLPLYFANVKNSLRYLVPAMTFLYMFAITAWLVLRAATGDAAWWLAFVNTFALLAFALLVPLGLVIRYAPSRLARISWLGAFVIGIIWFAPAFLPKPPLGANSEMQIKIMTLNLYDQSLSAEPMLERIRAEQPDVVVLQELNDLNASALSGLSAPFPYQSLMPLEGRDAGLGVISKFPFTDHSWYPLANVPQHAQWLTLDAHGHTTELLNVHLESNWLTVSSEASRADYDQANRLREQQARDILAFVRPYSSVIVAGDLNTSDTTTPYSILQSELNDSFGEAGWGLGATFSSEWFWYGRIPVPPRLLRLDYIWHTHDFVTTEAHVGERDSQSDHLPVIATLQLTTSQLSNLQTTQR